MTAALSQGGKKCIKFKKQNKKNPLVLFLLLLLQIRFWWDSDIKITLTFYCNTVSEKCLEEQFLQVLKRMLQHIFVFLLSFNVSSPARLPSCCHTKTWCAIVLFLWWHRRVLSHAGFGVKLILWHLQLVLVSWSQQLLLLTVVCFVYKGSGCINTIPPCF